MGMEDRYYDESLIEDFNPITEISDFKIVFSDSVEFNFSFINKKTNKKSIIVLLTIRTIQHL